MSLLRAGRAGLRGWGTALSRRGVFSSATSPTSSAASSPSTVSATSAPTESASISINADTVQKEADKFAPDAWTSGQPTRYIAHKLLDRDRAMCGLRELYEEVMDSGMFRSKRHFKQCLKMMKCKNRVQIICLGPVAIGSPNLKFAVKLTGKGQRTYLFYRNHYRARVAVEGEGDNDGKPSGLTDAL